MWKCDIYKSIFLYDYNFFIKISFSCRICRNLTIYKELYRMEDNIRGMEDEKKTSYYNKIL